MRWKHSLRYQTNRQSVESMEVFGKTHLQTLFNVAQWAVDGNFDVLPSSFCDTLELGSREPRREVLHFV